MPGAQFEFEIDFENLESKELGALLYCLELEEGMLHRLGYGKPLGLGSVKVSIQSVQVFNLEQRFASSDLTLSGIYDMAPDKRQELVDSFHVTMREVYGTTYDAVLLDLRTILTKPPSQYPTHYPRPKEYVAEDGRNFEWFVGNKRRIATAKREKKSPKQGGSGDKASLPPPVALPQPPDESQGLPLIGKDGKSHVPGG